MALTSERIDAIAAEAGRLFAAGNRLDAVARAVRDANPGLPVTATLASLMAEEPYREEERFVLHLVDNSDHCWRITRVPAAADGLVIAERDDDA